MTGTTLKVFIFLILFSKQKPANHFLQRHAIKSVGGGRPRRESANIADPMVEKTIPAWEKDLRLLNSMDGTRILRERAAGFHNCREHTPATADQRTYLHNTTAQWIEAARLQIDVGDQGGIAGLRGPH